MTVNNKKLGNIVPFPLLPPPQLPELKLDTKKLDEKMTELSKIRLLILSTDFHEKWLRPQLKMKNIPTIWIGNFDWSVFENRIIKQGKLDTYFLQSGGILGVASEGIFAVSMKFFATNIFDGPDGLIRNILDNQNTIIKYILYGGIIDYIYGIHLFHYLVDINLIKPLIEQSKWLFENLGLGYVA
ncbi:MAG: hypothetical protein ACTSRP_12335 [Candidatus Helarchaeota archaeon]